MCVYNKASTLNPTLPHCGRDLQKTNADENVQSRIDINSQIYMWTHKCSSDYATMHATHNHPDREAFHDGVDSVSSVLLLCCGASLGVDRGPRPIGYIISIKL